MLQLDNFGNTMPGQQEAAQELMLGVLTMGTAPEDRGRHVPIQGPPRPLRQSSRSSAGSGAGRPHMRLGEVTVPIRPWIVLNGNGLGNGHLMSVAMHLLHLAPQ